MSKRSIKKDEKGITLIALALTIIVLLIIAVVVINIATNNNGLIGRTLESTVIFDIANAKEYTEIWVTEKLLDYYAYGSPKTPVEYIKDQIGDGVNVGGPYYIKEVPTSFGEVVGTKKIASIEEIQVGAIEKLYINVYKGSSLSEALASTKLITGDILTNGDVEWDDSTITTGGSDSGSGSGSGSEPGSGTTPASSNFTQQELSKIAENGMVELTENNIANSNLKNNANIRGVITGNIPIPNGYTYVEGVSTDVSTKPDGKNYGVVIQDDNGNQWVWVPVQSASSMYYNEDALVFGDFDYVSDTEWIDVYDDESNYHTEQQSTYGYYDPVYTNKYSKSEIAGLYRNSPGGFKYSSSEYSAEPAIPVRSITASGSGFYEDNNKSGIVASSYDNIENLVPYDFVHDILGVSDATSAAEKIIADYNRMIESVEKYGGFYVARYELGKNSSNNPVIKSGDTYNNIEWGTAYNICKNFDASQSVETSMMWGCQWDVICNWINTSGDQKGMMYANSDAPSNWGNYAYTKVYANDGTTVLKDDNETKILQTGITNFTRANNIYDFAGNAAEWTQEVYFDYSYDPRYMVRGGNYYTSDDWYACADNGEYKDMYDEDDSTTTRPMLIIK